MGVREIDPLAQLSLPPGFRFYPTDEELLVQYLCRKVAGHPFSLPIIAEINLYKFDPWVLPGKAIFGEKEWYFFSPRDRKYPNGSRPNRVAGSGYWKATGTDKVITAEGRKVGIKKALVFYVGKAPKGSKTNWIMHEYRLLNSSVKNIGTNKLDDWVLCRIYKKNSSAEKAIATKEYSSSGAVSSLSSSSHVEDMLDLPEINDSCFALPRINSLRNFQDWVNPAGLDSLNEFGNQSQGMVNYGGNDLYAPIMPPFCHVDSLTVPENPTEDEVQSCVRTQRVDENAGLFQRNPNVYTDRVDPFLFGFRE